MLWDTMMRNSDLPYGPYFLHGSIPTRAPLDVRREWKILQYNKSYSTVVHYHVVIVVTGIAVPLYTLSLEIGDRKDGAVVQDTKCPRIFGYVGEIF